MLLTDVQRRVEAGEATQEDAAWLLEIVFHQRVRVEGAREAAEAALGRADRAMVQLVQMGKAYDALRHGCAPEEEVG